VCCAQRPNQAQTMCLGERGTPCRLVSSNIDVIARKGGERACSLTKTGPYQRQRAKCQLTFVQIGVEAHSAFVRRDKRHQRGPRWVLLMFRCNEVGRRVSEKLCFKRPHRSRSCTPFQAGIYRSRNIRLRTGSRQVPESWLL